MLLLHQSSIIISFIQQDKKNIKYITSRHTQFLISVKVCGNSYFLNVKNLYLFSPIFTTWYIFHLIEAHPLITSLTLNESEFLPLIWNLWHMQIINATSWLNWNYHVFITWRKYLAPFILLTLSLYRSSSRLLKKVRQSHHNSDSIRLSSEPLLTLPLTRASLTRWRRISQG